MSYGEIVRVGAPIEAYQAMHQQIGELLGGQVPEGAIGADAFGAEPRFLEFEPTTTVTFAAYNSDRQR